ncbi:Light-sensor Protein kinase [Pseudocyphellaria aurata]|nr:Light-sensor Protein kinase [Pseudocyphellaria aurata]
MSSDPSQEANGPSSSSVPVEETTAPPNPPCWKTSVAPSRLTMSRHRNSDLSDLSLRLTSKGTQGAESPVLSSSDSPFDQLSPLTTDRVYPMRSVVSVDPTSTPSIRNEGYGGDGFPGMVLPGNSVGANITERRTERRQHSIHSLPSMDKLPDCIETSSKPTLDTVRSAAATDREANLRSSITGQPVTRRPSYARGAGERMGGSRQIQTFVDNVSTKSESVTGGAEDAAPSTMAPVRNLADDTGGDLVTARFKHAVIEGGHTVITGRGGSTLQRCEDEPIHIPGAVQSFGLLIALQEDDDGKFKVRVVSENSMRIVGYTPKQLFDLDSFCDILSEDQTDNLLDHVDFVRDDDADPATNGPEVFTIAIHSPMAHTLQKLWCAMHANQSNRDLIICEFELEDDTVNPLVPVGEATPEPPEDTLHSNPTAEEFAESTVNSSKPLRVLRSARKRKGEAAAMEVFNIMSQVQEQLANAPNLDVFLKVLVGVVKELTGFHRVMVYQFDQAWNGKVVTELVDTRATKDLYRGLHFPKSDIPAQARELYKINKVRLLYDRDQETARLVCRTVEDLETPLDLTFAYLRAMSPIHIKYLANMAVRASMSISINAFNELWGLIACHSYGSKGMRVSFPIRKMCRLVGDSASRNIERLSYASRLQARKLINTAPTEHNPSGYIIASSDDLLKLFGADYGLLSVREETKILGKLEQTQEALALLEYLRLRKITSVTTSTDIRIDFPDIRYTPGFAVIAGLLFVPLSVTGSDFIVFFRKGQIREVKWAGNPYDKLTKEGTEGYLEPRRSFAVWSETVVGKCREWTEEQIETAAVLCLVYGKFIEVWRQKEAALQNSQLTKLLLANSAHEVRTPLNAIINYLEIALEGAIDQETRENLSKSHSASKSLIYVINDLLDLTKTEEGHDLIKDEVFDLPATIREAADMFAGDAKRKNIEYDVIENPGVPQYVVGDQRRVRQAISNVTANAIQHTPSGAVKIELWLVERAETRVEVDIVVQDTGVGMSAAKLDYLFRDLEQVQSETEDILLDKIPAGADAISEKSHGQKTLGLGLALVARIIRNMNGQLRLKSEEGKGSRFVIQLGFELPDSDAGQNFLASAVAAGIAPPSQPSTPPVEKGEVLLVNNSVQKASLAAVARDMSRRRSIDSINSLRSPTSLKSFKSGSKSEVDRLIDAIQEPHLLTKNQSADAETQSPRLGGRSERRPGLSRHPSSLARSHSMSMLAAMYRDHTEIDQLTVIDSCTPASPSAMSTKSPQVSPTFGFHPRTPSRTLFDIPTNSTLRPDPPTAEDLHILVAEDDPINSKIMKKRLEKSGHTVQLTINGEECSSAYEDSVTSFDVVLMDMQMPIVDGLTSTKMIRSFEKTHPGRGLSNRAALNGRVPIIAVSASLVEKDRQLYIDAGFDGWILKPIDFKRLSTLLCGIVEEHTRKHCLYKPGEWEQGGWFAQQQPDVFQASTAPSGKATNPKTPPPSFPSHLDDPISKEQARLDHLETDAVHANSFPDDPGVSGDAEKCVEEGAAVEATPAPEF